MCTDQQVQQDIITIIQNNGGYADPGVVVDTIYKKYGYRIHQKQISPSKNISDLLRQKLIRKNSGYIEIPEIKDMAELAQEENNTSH